VIAQLALDEKNVKNYIFLRARSTSRLLEMSISNKCQGIHFKFLCNTVVNCTFKVCYDC